MAGRGCAPGERRGGRHKGVPNKFTQDVRDMILQAVTKAGGVDYLVERALDTPGPFLALLGKLVPLQVNANVKHTRELTDAELAEHIPGSGRSRTAETPSDTPVVH